jgi:cytochrome c peroxidase
MKLYSVAVFCIVLVFAFANLQNDVAMPYSGPTTAEELGKILFQDSILSEDYSISCASCHKPQFAFSDTVALSPGVRGQKGTRNTPTAMNVLSRPFLFWDGRATSLEEQALIPIENPMEMNLPADSAVARLKRNSFYVEAFNRIYGAAPSKALLSDALAAFERTLETGSDHDRFMNGDSTAISAAAMRGLEIFNIKGKCFECHFGPDLTGDEFRSIGLFDNVNDKDKGRYDISKDSVDFGKFKVPSLRNVAVTGPYMHDGRFATLEAVVDHYSRGIQAHPHLDANLKMLNGQPMRMNFSSDEKDALVAFLRTLTDYTFVTDQKYSDPFAN